MRFLLRALAVVATVAAVLVAAVMATFVVGVRTRNPGVLRAARTLQRDYANKSVLQTAGRPGARYQIIRHTGRTSGKQYETPIEAVPFDGGFYIALVYGEQTQWVRNVLAGGAAAILHEGVEHPVGDARLVPIAETPLATTNRTANTIMGITTAIRLSTADR